MLFGGSTWSELPISSLTVPLFNGEEFNFTSAIDTELAVISTIDQVLEPTGKIDTTLAVTGTIDQVDNFTLTIDSSKEQTLI